ncbi:MAG: hypothetical protein AABY43_00450 [Candidatus Omnitrophota bacterium]
MKKVMKNLSVLLLCLILNGCAFPTTYRTEQINLVRNDKGEVILNKWNNPPNLSIGMTTEEVKANIGEPSKIITKGDKIIYLYYKEGFRWIAILTPLIPLGRERYELIFKQNKLESILEKITY